MKMFETKKALEDALFNGKELPYDAMANCYVAVQNYLARCDGNNDLVDKIASFFEREENWHELKCSWLINDKSESLRRLLREALKECPYEKKTERDILFSDLLMEQQEQM